MAKIVCRNVHKAYGKNKVLQGISFECENKILFIAGRNGAGKTTLIRIALGMEKADEGLVSISCSSKTRGAVFDTPSLYSQMTCSENIDIFCTGYLQDIRHVEEIKESLQIDKVMLKKRVSKCSFGQQHRLSAAIALIRRPECLFLDEPTAGLDPLSWEAVRNAILKNKDEQDGFIVITGQDYTEMASLADHLVILDEGTAKYSGSMDNFLSKDPDLKTAVYKHIKREDRP